MPTRGRGLYEELLTPELAAELAELTDRLVPRQGALRPAEAADRIALHLSKLIERTIDDFKDHERVAKGVEFAQTLVDAIRASLDDESLAQERPVSPGTVLRAIESRRPDGTPETIEAPLIPLLDTTLLTNAPGEPNVGSQLRTEIASAERIDVVMAFVRHTGIARMLDALETHCHQGRSLRVHQ